MKENPFLPLGKLLYKKTKKLLRREKTCKALRTLNVVSKQELDKLCDEYYISMITGVITTVAICLVLSMVIWIRQASKDHSILLKRDGYGGVMDKLELETKVGEDRTAFSVDVYPMTYEAGQMEKVFDQGFTYIDSVYLGENQSADAITTDMNLVDEIGELGLQVSWISDQYQLINGRGEITDDALASPVFVELIATLHYEDYMAQRQYMVCLLGKTETDSEKAISEIRKFISDLQTNAPDVQNIEVPDTIYGYQIQVPEKGNPAFVLLVLGLVAAGMFLLKGQSDIKEKTILRNDALLVEYPAFVEKLSLYMGAGLTIRGALMKIISMSSPENKLRYHNILFEEIKYTLNEIQSGMPESEAYYKLGHRLNLPVYLKITSLLSQNMKKGTKDILEMLTEEERAAFQMRKELAKKKGEEAGTRLLLPMMLLLGIVIVIVVCPALMSF